ncbi:MAG: metallophosphoesterase [Lachnospiraceae bacterium]|nr:metallophosphoesterase [Lachnospiraceae bacterium]
MGSLLRSITKNCLIKLTAALAAAVFLTAGCTVSDGPAAEEEQNTAAQAGPADTVIEYRTIVCEGIKDTYKLVFMSDLHIIAKEDTSAGMPASDDAGGRYIDPGAQQTVDSRYEAFAAGGLSSAEYWEELASGLDDLEADAVLLGGDMIDFCTPNALRILSYGLRMISAPVMYVRADHDTGIWYSEGSETEEDAEKWQDELADNGDVLLLQLPELWIIGINNSTEQISADALYWVQYYLSECRNRDIPAVILTHVPFQPETDTGLAAACGQSPDGRNLFWGPDGYHFPDSNTSDLLSLLYADDSPAAAVFAGHLHFGYEGPLADNAVYTMQYIGEPAFAHRITVFTITGKN